MDFDAIIIGTGQAGPSLARELAQNGYRTAIIEKSEVGGTCVNTGCTPTKAYVACARRAHVARDSAAYGVSSSAVKIDLKTIKQRKDELIQGSREGLEKSLSETKNLTLIKGKAKFTDTKQVEVNGESHKADKIFINVGGRPKIPKGFEEVDYLTNESILELEELPKHLVIVGGGYIGLEFAQMFRRFGSEVTIVEMADRLLNKEDSEACKVIRELFLDEGINVRYNAECIRATSKDGQIIADLDCTEGDRQVIGTHLLVATGRIPNTDDLGLENTGIRLDNKGYIQVNDHLQTHEKHIWALGDCNGKGAFTHTSFNDYQIVSSHLFGDSSRKLSDRIPCYATYIDPALARVGMDAAQINAAGIRAKVAHIPMSSISRAKEMGETRGYLKIFIESATDKLLGATFLGPGADEYIHTVIDQMYAGATYRVMRDAVHIHPTISELIPTMLGSLEDLES